MRTTVQKKTLAALAAALLMSALALPAVAQNRNFAMEARDVTAVDVSPVLTPKTVEDTDHLTELVIENALDIRRNAARLKSLTRFPEQTSWQTHAAKLRDTQGHLENLGREVDMLYDAVRVLLPRQREALEYIGPELPNLIDSVDEAIQFVNDNRGEFWSDEYANYIDEMYESADSIAAAAELANQFFTPAD